MNIELYSYSVMASILGIVIVFVSLLGLSLLMVLLKVLFQDREKPSAPAKVSSKPDAAPAAGAGSRPEEGQEWIMAAVVAFLMEEDTPPPSAAAWGRRSTEVLDPWMNRAAFDKSAV
jgi:hypothetical protein